MSQEKNSAAEPLEKGAQAAGMVKGAVKTGKALAGATKGAAAGGPYGAVAGFVWGNRKLLLKIILITAVILLLPILFILMLPALIFGGLINAFSPDNPSTPILNDNTAIMSNMSEVSDSVRSVLSDSLDDILAEIDRDFNASDADKKEVINPHENSPVYNANSFVSQYCASRNEDFEKISFSDMESMLKKAKDELYTYTKREETRSRDISTITVDTETGTETSSITTVIEKWAVYTITYRGESYFADSVFNLSPEQKDLASNYAENLSLFLEDGMFQGLPEGYETVSSLGDIQYSDGQTPVVYYNQTDERYAGKPYGTDKIGSHGCGPTAMAIVVSSLTDEVVDPAQMAEWSYEHGYWAAGNGSYHALIPAAAKAWGLPVEGCSADNGQKIVDALSKGKLVVAIMVKGHFTTSGHFIVLRGVKDDKILVADPASQSRSEKEWDLSIILDEASTHAAAGGPFWIIG